MPVKLSPGEVHAKTLPMRTTGAGSVSFRMGFTPLEYKADSPWRAGKRAYGSSEVMIEAN
jgi:hypothetical protein